MKPAFASQNCCSSPDEVSQQHVCRDTSACVGIRGMRATRILLWLGAAAGISRMSPRQRNGVVFHLSCSQHGKASYVKVECALEWTLPFAPAHVLCALCRM
eukprot:TRINITY_DN8367_c0_g1_i1.p3 TRINITY_DN8367_c0_g1~~TRINITY_DN8367_c0_g1_i1.p3  ORF type:complete len:101 (-),score=6.56 TRINITY_DN8367_c0_g1_i1:142-444(-)